MNAPKAKGTRWETAVVEYLRMAGVPHAERRALNGAGDQGDIAGLPGIVIEAKNCRTVDLAGWLDEAETERANARADVGVAWHHRRGKSSPGQGYVTMTGETFVALLRAAGYIWGDGGQS